MPSSYRNPAPKPRAPARATSPANPLAVGSSVHAISTVRSESSRVCRPVSWKPELSRIVATRSARKLFCLALAGPGRRAGGAGSAPPAVALGAARATSEAARASRAPGAVSRARRHTDVAPSERRHECVPPAQAQSAGEPSATRHGCVATRRAWPMPHWTTGVGTGPTGNNTRRRRQRRGAMRVSFL